jgi:glycosyltransferase involved in cell wall biosynthesis
MKKLSIIVANYNDKKRVQRAIKSALNQTYGNVEVILVDDGSDKETRALYKPFLNDLKLIQRERVDKNKRTCPEAYNEGLKASTGDYVSILMKYDNDVIFCNWKIIGLTDYKVEIEKKWKDDVSLLNNYLALTHLDHQCMAVKRDVQMKVGLYDERLARSQDADMRTERIVLF